MSFNNWSSVFRQTVIFCFEAFLLQVCPETNKVHHLWGVLGQLGEVHSHYLLEFSGMIKMFGIMKIIKVINN